MAQCTDLRRVPNTKSLVPCGKCFNCRTNFQNRWCTSLALEAVHHKNDIHFITLTYDDDNYPKDGSISKEEVQKFMKRLRRYVEYYYTHLPANRSVSKDVIPKLKYFAVGEYGSRTGRAHYHLILYGFDSALHPVEYFIDKAWTKGFTRVDMPKSKDVSKAIRYLTKYITKSLVSTDINEEEDDKEKPARQKEFSLKSHSLGLAGLNKLAEQLRKKNVYPVQGLSTLEKSAFYWIYQDLFDDEDPEKPVFQEFKNIFAIGENRDIFYNPSDLVIDSMKRRGKNLNFGSLRLPLLRKLLELSHPDLIPSINYFLFNNPPPSFWRYHQERVEDNMSQSYNFKSMQHNQMYVNSDGRETGRTIYEEYKAQEAKAKYITNSKIEVF